MVLAVAAATEVVAVDRDVVDGRGRRVGGAVRKEVTVATETGRERAVMVVPVPVPPPVEDGTPRATGRVSEDVVVLEACKGRRSATGGGRDGIPWIALLDRWWPTAGRSVCGSAAFVGREPSGSSPSIVREYVVSISVTDRRLIEYAHQAQKDLVGDGVLGRSRHPEEVAPLRMRLNQNRRKRYLRRGT